MSQKRKKKGGGGVFLHWCAMHSGKIAHTHFQTLSKPQQHTERSHVCLTLIILLQKKKGGGIISKGTNQLLPCLQQLTNLCLSNKSESSSSVQKTSGTAHIKSGPCGSRVDSTILLLWGPASNAPPTCLQLVFPDSPLHSRNRDRFLLSHWAQSLDKVLSSYLPSSLSFKYLKKIVFF